MLVLSHDIIEGRVCLELLRVFRGQVNLKFADAAFQPISYIKPELG